MPADTLPEAKILQDERLLTTKQAGAASGFHPTHFNSQIIAGKIPATKDEKGRWQIKQSDLDKYLASKTVKPRRQNQFTKTDDDKPETSLLTQLDEKTRKNQNLIAELEASKRIIEDMTRKHATKLDEANRALTDKENELGRAKNRIEGLKEENRDLKLENAEHTEFLRTTIKDLLSYVTK